MENNIQTYPNFVLENKMTDLTNTYLNVGALYTVDDSLETSAGLKKVIHKYTYTGTVEKLAKGQKNSVRGKVGFEPVEYTVSRYQQTYDLSDDEVMEDPYVSDVAIKGAAQTMANEIRDEYFTELEKISMIHEYEGDFTYTSVVDALLKRRLEKETDLFLIVSLEQLAEIRKDSLFVESKQGEILYTGQVGTICGRPLVCSTLVPDGTSYITTKDAVKLITKRKSKAEQQRDAEAQITTYVHSRHGVMALVDDTRSIKIKKKAG